jgi:hypothetical protein
MIGTVAVVISRMHEKNLARQIAAVASERGGLGIECSWFLSAQNQTEMGLMTYCEDITFLVCFLGIEESVDE